MVKSNYIYLTLHQFGTGNFFIDLEEIERVFVEKQRFEDPAGKDWSGLAYAHELWTEEKKYLGTPASKTFSSRLTLSRLCVTEEFTCNFSKFVNFFKSN